MPTRFIKKKNERFDAFEGDYKENKLIHHLLHTTFLFPVAKRKTKPEPFLPYNPTLEKETLFLYHSNRTE